MRRLLVLLAPFVLAAPLLAQDAATLDRQMRTALSAEQWESAAAAAGKLVELSPRNAEAWFYLGYALHSQKRYAEALEAHVKASEFPTYGNVAAYNAACAHALLGQTDDAFQWLDKAMAKGFANLAQVRSDPDLASLRGDARFAEVITKLGGKPATGGADAGDGPPPNVRVFAGTTDRKSSRLFYWDGRNSPGQVAVGYGPIAWKDEYAGMIGSEQLVGKRWRLGGNFWTTLDTNLDLTLGGADVPAGLYYVTLEQKSPGEFVLQLNDPASIREKKLDAFLSERVTGGIEIPLKHSESDEVARTLKIEVATMKGADPRDGSFTVAFGPHRLEAALRTKLN